MNRIFTGAATALVTPFADGRVDYASLRNLIERQIEMGADALVVLGTTGEISTLTLDEKHEVIQTAIRTADGRIPIIFGIGGNNPAEIIELGLFVKEASVLGRSKTARVGIMITAPYYNKATQDGIYEFFKAITDTVKLPAVVYNIPGRTGINIESETMYRISTLRYIAGIKEASGNISQIADVVLKCPGTAVYAGDDTLALPCYAVGCQGIISVAGNIAVEPVRAIYEKHKKGRHASALLLFQSQLPFYKSLFTHVNPIPVKHYLAKMGLIRNELRLPLLPVN